MGDHVKELMEGAEEGAYWDGGSHRYRLEKVVGNGAFGIVWRARCEDGDVVAIKKVLLDRRYHNRELQMMKVMEHENIVRLRHFFEKQGKKKDETYLHLVMDYLPETLRSVALLYHKRRKRFQVEHIKAFLWQTFRALEYIHARRICHRDIKPDNLLCDPATMRCRLCDFGCSKVLVKGQPNVSYICSRYYRAPELMFGATEYGVGVDVWSVGTILMELLLGHLPFQGQDSTQQHLVEIMKLLGTPSDRDLQAMRSSCCADDLPKLKPFPWDRVFPPGTHADAIDLAQRLLRYDPDQRLTASQTLAHPFFDGAQQLVEASDGAHSQGAVGGPSVAPRASASEWEHRLNRCFDDLASEGAQLQKVGDAILTRIKQMGDNEQQPPVVAQQVVSIVRQELSTGLKQRADAVRAAQKRMLLEAQQLQLSFPLEQVGEQHADASTTDVKELERQLAEVQRSAQEAAELVETEKAQLREAIRAAKAKLEDGGSGGRGDAEHADMRECGTQTEEDSRATTPGFGRRAVAPTRSNTLIDHHLATASPLSQRPSEARPSAAGGQHMMVQTDNLGQVTPLSSFSPCASGNSPLTRTGSAGRRAKGAEEQNS